MPIARIAPALAAAVLALVPLAAAFAAPQDPVKTPPIPADTEVKTLPSGLKYCVYAAGDGGASPKIGDLVKVHYTGWFTDGKVFDSSRSRGEATEFKLGDVIPGWNQALALMTTGARWKITLPPDLAYGPQGAGGVIPPNATLIFDVELISFRGHPAFRKPDPAAQKKTASGLKYEVLAAAGAKDLAADECAEIEFALYDAEGHPVQSSAVEGACITGRCQDMAVPFLKEAFALVKEGGDLLLEVPANLCFAEKPYKNLPPNSVTVWRLRLVRSGRPRPAPAFEMPPKDKLETLPSGLQMWLVKQGTGEPPAMGQGVVVDYAGWLTDGTLFDDSFKTGLPANFKVGQLIEGWNEALLRMKPPATAWLVIPGKLAYGPRGQGAIPPNATLVFRMELHEVKK